MISQKGGYDAIKSMTDLITYADGKNDLLDISERIHVPVAELIPIIWRLQENKLMTII